MLIAYILTKSRFLKVKLVRLKDANVFKKGIYEYNINRNKIYQKKALGIKLFFWSMYLEGNPEPIEFRDKDYVIDHNEVPIDDIALILNKLRIMKLELVIAILVAFNFLLSIGVIYKLYGE